MTDKEIEEYVTVDRVRGKWRMRWKKGALKRRGLTRMASRELKAEYGKKDSQRGAEVCCGANKGRTSARRSGKKLGRRDEGESDG